ncbi:MAG: mannosyltransferase family protein [Solirubrobacteraceae bacterium]
MTALAALAPGALERLGTYRVAVGAYLGTRGALVIVALLDAALRHTTVANAFTNWDGQWYRALALSGYPSVVSHGQTTLGFFPLYPLVLWLLAHVPYGVAHVSMQSAVTWTGIVVSFAGGLVATVLAQELATGWWGEAAGRRAAIAFCLFPGSVVFSMVYAEGLMIPLAMGTLWALERRRWLLAGALAGLATAVEPEAALLVPVCMLAAARELRRRGWRSTTARRSLLAPALSATGGVAVGAYLWLRTGSPLATAIAQHDGWHEHASLLAVPDLALKLASEISFAHFDRPSINLNLVSGLIGSVVLVVLLVAIVRARRSMPAEALLWTLGISVAAFTASYPFSPNPRVLITAFPAVLVIGRFVRKDAFRTLTWGLAATLVLFSSVVFVGQTLRP